MDMNSVSVKVILSEATDTFLTNLKSLLYQFEHLEANVRLVQIHKDIDNLITFSIEEIECTNLKIIETEEMAQHL